MTYPRARSLVIPLLTRASSILSDERDYTAEIDAQAQAALERVRTAAREARERLASASASLGPAEGPPAAAPPEPGPEPPLQPGPLVEDF